MKRTAFVYDPFNLRHTLAGHPENYRRLEGTWALLQSDGILETLHRLPSSPAPLDALHLIHPPHYVSKIQTVSEGGGGRLDPDTYANVDSYQAALLSAGGVLNVLDAVMQDEADNGFALVRPPGHHALVERAMGFCLFANVAVAAAWAKQKYGLERVLIIDFDVHHGNGTQDIFYDDPSVLFFSTHQYPYYPGSGAADERGRGLGHGMTVNVPLAAQTGDAGYLAIFQKLLAPLAREFQPALILLSAGYDAHWLDPLAGINLSIPGYDALVSETMALADELCDGRLVCALEGGYHLDVLPHCVLSTLRLLSGSAEGVSDPFGPSPEPERNVDALIRQLQQLHGIETE